MNTETNAPRKAPPTEKTTHVLTQQELVEWWPFTRLDPKRFPKTTKTPKPAYPDGEDALV